MWNPPTQKQLARLPKLYETDKTPIPDKIIHMHFFLGGCDWYACEYDEIDKLFFGYVILNSNTQCAEWGVFSLEELKSIRLSFMQVDREIHWKKTKAEDIEKITIH